MDSLPFLCLKNLGTYASMLLCAKYLNAHSHIFIGYLSFLTIV